MNLKRAAVILGALFCLAAEPDPAERLPDSAAEAQARALFQETRCLVCQGQSIDDSDAELAHDLRKLIRSQVASGRSPEQVRAFLTARYGDYVLLRPPLAARNAVLWVGPFLIALAGLGLLAARLRRPIPTPVLTADETARLAVLDRDDPV